MRSPILSFIFFYTHITMQDESMMSLAANVFKKKTLNNRIVKFRAICLLILIQFNIQNAFVEVTLSKNKRRKMELMTNHTC